MAKYRKDEDQAKRDSAREKKRKLKQKRKHDDAVKRRTEREKEAKARHERTTNWPLRKLKEFWKTMTELKPGKEVAQAAALELRFAKARIENKKLRKEKGRLVGKNSSEFKRYSRYMAKLRKQLKKKKNNDRPSKVTDREVEKIISIEDEIERVKKILYGDLVSVA